VFGEKEEIALKQLRKKFEFSSIYGDYLHKKKEFLENYV
jgi:hypothetical protein